MPNAAGTPESLSDKGVLPASFVWFLLYIGSVLTRDRPFSFVALVQSHQIPSTRLNACFQPGKSGRINSLPLDLTHVSSRSIRRQLRMQTKMTTIHAYARDTTTRPRRRVRYRVSSARNGAHGALSVADGAVLAFMARQRAGRPRMAYGECAWRVG